MGLKYSPEDLNEVTGKLKAGYSQVDAGLCVTKAETTVLDGNTTGQSVMETANTNLQAYAAALNKNITDMFQLGANFEAFDEAQRNSNLNK